MDSHNTNMVLVQHTEDFVGTIGRTIAESEPWHPEPTHPGGCAPNVVLVLLDDTGCAPRERR